MTIRRAAFETLRQIIEDDAFANLALKQRASSVSHEDIPMLHALVYTALEHRSYIEYILSCYCKRPKAAVRIILLLSASELLFMNTPDHVAINEAVNLTKELGKSGTAGFVNAVLRRIQSERDSLPSLPSDPFTRLCILYGYPAFIIREWINEYGSENAERLLSFPPTGLQIRAQFPYTVQLLKDDLIVPYTVGKHDPNCLYVQNGFDTVISDLFQCGKITVQNEGSMMICRTLGDLSGKRILDACAAPGGKTAYICSLAQNRVDITAWEKLPHRKKLMEQTFARLHVTAHTECRDASVPYPEESGRFDIVLLDVPCSGFGLLGDKPDLRYRRSDADIQSLVKEQRAILSACAKYVKHGGLLVYSTCTISKRENQEQIAHFCSHCADYDLQSEKQYLPFQDGIDGFYCAVMKRR